MDVPIDPAGADWAELAKIHDPELLEEALLLYPVVKMKKKTQLHPIIRDVMPDDIREELIYINEVETALDINEEQNRALRGVLTTLKARVHNRRTEAYLLRERVFGRGYQKKDDGVDAVRAQSSFDRKLVYSEDYDLIPCEDREKLLAERKRKREEEEEEEEGEEE